MFALIDVNGMYASCEQAFRPDLANRAVAVLSNNDGNIVARNYLAKKAGLKMGDPYFKVRPIIERHNIAIFSSNYTLYASMSARFAAVVESLASHVEQYSIDECFLDTRGIDHCMNLEDFGRQLRGHVLSGTGLTIGVGFGATKTLAISPVGVKGVAAIQGSSGVVTGQPPPHGKITQSATGRGNLGRGEPDSEEAEGHGDQHSPAAVSDQPNIYP